MQKSISVHLSVARYRINKAVKSIVVLKRKSNRIDRDISKKRASQLRNIEAGE